jgi:hypothetical protein
LLSVAVIVLELSPPISVTVNVVDEVPLPGATVYLLVLVLTTVNVPL